ncbi:hypothetical protein KM043_018149 [Ampulex compressa]|nr:hypothetical protein KM043_018149 [Ampulex compressa]
MNVDLQDEEIAMLSTYCNIDNLTVPGETPKIYNEKVLKRKGMFKPALIPDDTDLNTLKNLKKNLREESAISVMKRHSELVINYDKLPQNADVAVPGEDILVYVRVYEPFVHHIQYSTDSINFPRINLNSVIAILGSQTLAQLRDSIQCISDLSIPTDVSDKPNQPLGPMAKDVYKSGFFYIEDKFYNDFRDESNIDYSQVIIEWGKKHGVGPFQTGIMEDTQIASLYARFGFPWVYQHQGNCEHVIILSDARLIHCDDELSRSAYPRIVKIKPRSARLCMMCGLFSAYWIVTDSDRIPHNPCFFCDACFKSYNYINKKKVGNFKAYAYPCHTELSDKKKA